MAQQKPVGRSNQYQRERYQQLKQQTFQTNQDLRQGTYQENQQNRVEAGQYMQSNPEMTNQEKKQYMYQSSPDSPL